MKGKNLIYEISQLDRLMTEKECLLYGAGRVGMTVVKHLAQKRIWAEQILVSSKWNNPDSIMGIPVNEIGMYTGNMEGKCLIVTSSERLHGEVSDEISRYNFAEVYFCSDELFREITFEMGDFEVENYYRLKTIEGKIQQSKESLLHLVPRPCLEYMILNILDHCNLRCRGCDHFACIADEYTVPYETLHRDLDRLAEIFHGEFIERIAVMGGEPLLHPELLDILKDVRAHFPYTTIRLTTNGLLLLRQKDDFWRVCRENDVTIVNTKYPLNLDFEGMKSKAEEEHVKFEYFEETGDHIVKKSFKKYINLKGDSDPVMNFVNCTVSNYGNFLMEGKLYSCPFSAQSYRIFNKKFGQKLRMTQGDYLDIYKVMDKQEIFDFAAKPKYYCRYCTGLSSTFDWTRSEGSIYEWVEEEN